MIGFGEMEDAGGSKHSGDMFKKSFFFIFREKKAMKGGQFLEK